MTDSEGLTKIYVDLPNHWATSGESMRALAVGENLYELHNVPFYAYDLNFLDIVEAVSDREDLKPELRRVVRRSGHRTLRVFLSRTVTSSEGVALLKTLDELGATFERATKRLFAIDVDVKGNYDAVCARLDEWEKTVAYSTMKRARPVPRLIL
jgi:hypothetical protein